VAERVAVYAEEARVIKQAAMDTAEALKVLKIVLKRKVRSLPIRDRSLPIRNHDQWKFTVLRIHDL